MPPDTTEFGSRLAEAIAWCTRRASLSDPEHCLRTPSFRPAGFAEPRVFLADASARLQEGREQRQAFPEQVRASVEARAQKLRSEGRYPRDPAEHLAGGRLLAYDPDCNLADGAASQETRGFFDVDNVPPWDTWICFVHERDSSPWQPFDNYLLAWIPPQMVDLVEAGIWINPEECIVWADTLEAAFIAELRAAGWLT